MNIWIVNHHALSNEFPGGTRHFDQAKCLVENGHNVTIIASSFHYNLYKELKQYKNNEYYKKECIDGVNFVWLKTIPYTKNNIRRLFCYLSYSYQLNKVYSEIDDRPDIIIGSSVHLFAVNTAYKISKKLSVPFIMEVRDLWPQTLIDMGTNKWHPIVLMLKYLELKLYKKSDAIVSLLPFAKDYIVKQGIKGDKIHWIPNGVFKKHIISKTVDKSTNPFVVTYVGSLGVVNNIEYLLEAASYLKDHKDIVIKIIGGGVNKEKLIRYQEEHKLANVSFIDAVPKSEISQYISEANIVYISFLDSPLYKYGYSPNKLYDYLASGVLILFATDCKYNPIKDEKLGVTVGLDNAELMANKILELKKSAPKNSQVFLKNTNLFLENYHTLENLSKKLESICKDLIQKKANQ